MRRGKSSAAASSSAPGPSSQRTGAAASGGSAEKKRKKKTAAKRHLGSEEAGEGPGTPGPAASGEPGGNKENEAAPEDDGDGLWGAGRRGSMPAGPISTLLQVRGGTGCSRSALVAALTQLAGHELGESELEVRFWGLATGTPGPDRLGHPGRPCSRRTASRTRTRTPSLRQSSRTLRGDSAAAGRKPPLGGRKSPPGPRGPQ